MRLTLVLLSACVLYAQTGKPGVTDPIKDPQQVPGKPNPGAIPRETPPASAPDAGKKTRSRAKESKSTKKSEKPKANQPAR